MLIPGPSQMTTYTPPTGLQVMTGNNVSVNALSTGLLTWDAVASGAGLLNLSDNTQPRIVFAGIYLITVSVTVTSLLTVGVFYAAKLFLNATVSGQSQLVHSPGAISANQSPTVALCIGGYCAAGQQIKVTVDNTEAVLAKNFGLTSALVQRVT